MQYDVSSPQEYLEKLEEDWRKEVLLQVRKKLLDAHPFTESISYKMLAYGNQKKVLFHLNAQREYVSLYVGNIDKIADARNMLARFSLGKGCIRIKKSKQSFVEELIPFINKAVELWVAGKDIDC